MAVLEQQEMPVITKAPVRFTVSPTMKLAAASMLVLFITGGIWTYHAQSIRQINAQTQQYEQEAFTGRSTAKHLAAARLDAKVVTSELKNLESQVVPELFLPTLLRQVDTLAKRNGLEVMALKHTLELSPIAPDASVTAEEKQAFRPLPYDRDRIDIEVRGTYWGVARFLYRLTTFPKILAVETVTERPAEQATPQSGRIIATIRMTGFVFQPAAQGSKSIGRTN
jgi:Tfp pilus assembly protein PilO